MNAWTIIEPVLLLISIAGSAIYAFRQLAPRAWARGHDRLTLRLMQPGQPAWRRSLGRWIAPGFNRAAGSQPCARCEGCGPKS